MKKIIGILILILCLFNAEAKSMKKVKLAYIRSTWELDNGQYWKAEDIKGNLLTDLNISFAHIDRKGQVQLENKEYIKKQIAKLHEIYPDLRINISIGGWGAEGFSDAASNEKKRSVFVQSTLKLIKEMDLNGVDIDWEFPVGPDWGQPIKSSPKDKENYVYLLEDLKKALDCEEKLTGKQFILTTAIPSNMWFIEKNDVKAVSRICDYINLMCYDYYGDWTDTTGFNASLFTNPYDPVGWSSDTCFKLYIKKGIPAEKIVLGVPTYGFAWSGIVDNGTHGLFQKKGVFLGNFDYTELETKFSVGFEDYFDEISKQSYRYNSKEKIFVNYPSEKFMKAAAAYVKENQLAGIMYWEYGHDMKSELLQAISKAME